MSGRSRTIAAVLAFTLAGLLPASCPCAPATTMRAGHECCAPSAALRAVDDVCCGGAVNVTATLTIAPAPDVVLPAVAGPNLALPQGVATFSCPRALSVSPSPPPLILRI